MYSIPIVYFERNREKEINKEREIKREIRFIFTLSQDLATVYVENFLRSNSFRFGYKKRQTVIVYLINMVLRHQSMCMLIGLPQCGHFIVGVSTLKNSDT